MKMLVSDYDDTFYIKDEDIKRNIDLVKLFMKNNFFTIATGRSYFDFKKKKDLYGIEYNYLIINHGATIIRNNDVIYNMPIDNSVKNELIKDLKLEKTISNFACSELDSRVSLDNDNLTKIHVRYNTKDEAKEINELLIKKYLGKINSFLVCKDEAIEIVASEVNKSNAIRFIAKIQNIIDDNIYTIGDSYSDIEMIENFNGYCMTNSIKELKEIAIKEVDSVSDLINEVMRDSNE